MSKSTIRPDDKRSYEKVKGAMKKKKGKSGPVDPQGYKKFQKRVADLEKRYGETRRSALKKMFKQAEVWLKACKGVKDKDNYTDEQKIKAIELIIADMLAKVQMTPAIKAALDIKDFEKEVRKAVGALPDDDQNAANGHVDAIIRKIKKEREQTQALVDDTARALNKMNKSLAAGQMPDPVLMVVALIGLIGTVLKGRDKK